LDREKQNAIHRVELSVDKAEFPMVTYYDMTQQELTTWREKHDLTQIELASMLGVTKACISRWESGARKIPAFLHLALKCLKVKRGGERKAKGKGTERKRR
jgi:DNA-binding transcriptional regulator YiaG